MSNKTYNILKWVALVALDAIGLLYSTLAGIWALPCGDEICKTCVAMSLCLGTLIGVSGATYNPEEAEELMHGEPNWKEGYYNLLDEYQSFRAKYEENINAEPVIESGEENA